MVRMIMNLIQTFEGVLKGLKGSLRNYDGDGNENVTKQKVNEQNNDSTRVICLFSTIHFFAVLHKTAT